MILMKADEKTLQKFPVYEYADDLCNSLKNSKSRCLVLTAETGAGKSTVFPLSLLNYFSGNIIMTEPRRLSVLGTAERISSLLGETCGETCGYKIHLESRTSKKTRLHVVTEAILVRMIQDDFALEKFNVVVLDEFHQRSVSLDLISVFLKEAMELREDLYVVIMSATIDAKKIAQYFNGAPIMEIPGRTFPVEIEYKPGTEVESAVISHFNSTDSGNILGFLPGIFEISRCAENLRGHFEGIESVEILCLHSSVSIDEQKKVLKSQTENVRRIILSSAIAETSLTVPGVTCVIDSGLCRMNVFSQNLGMQKLVTVSESEFSAAQRSGRAGRTQKGKCIRLWSKNDVRQKEILPELLRSDLSSVVLECAERGEINLEKIDFIDRPSDSIWKETLFALKKCRMLEENRITEKGKCILKLGVDIRLGGLVLSAMGKAEFMDYARRIFFKYGDFSGSNKEIREKSWNDICRRIESLNYESEFKFSDKKMILLEGYADRLAKRVSDPGERNLEYQFVTGRKAHVHESSKINGEWIVALEADAGKTSAVIFAAEEISGNEFEGWIEDNCENRIDCGFCDGKILKVERKMLGNIILSERKLVPSSEDLIPAWKIEVQKKGLKALPLDEKSRRFMVRVEFYRQQKEIATEIEGELVQNFEKWLVPFMTGGSNPNSQTVYDALYWYFDGAEIDRNVPESIEFPNGRKFKVIYEKNEGIRPVVEVIIQRIFGCFETPKIMGKKILLRLLSPASRPLQITDELENFWTESWPDICKDMKGRYPKHNWDYRKVELE